MQELMCYSAFLYLYMKSCISRGYTRRGATLIMPYPVICILYKEINILFVMYVPYTHIYTHLDKG